MKVFTSISELAKGLNKDYLEIYNAEEKYIGRSYMCVEDIEIRKHFRDKEIYYVLIDENDDKDCKEYMMKYEIHEYNWKVYADDIEGWQECNVIDVKNNKLNIIRATVITNAGTQLNRLVKFALDDDEVEADGSIYFIEKE